MIKDSGQRRKYRSAKSSALVFSLTAMLTFNGLCQEGMQLGEERAASTEAETTSLMIEAIRAISFQRYPDGEVKRFNQSKGLGCFDANFAVSENLPVELQQGIFSSQQTFPAKIRFANATEIDDRKKDFRGMSIKVFNVPGVPLWGESGQQDFLLNSYPALFAANPADFLEFIEATRDDKVWLYFVRPGHWYSIKVIAQGRDTIDSPFAIRYWSTTPYRFGEDKSKAVKYSVQPCSPSTDKIAVDRHKDFLTDVMAEHLRKVPACFDFMVQFQTDPENMSIENAAIIWDESQSPFKKVATITIEDQDFNSAESVQSCEAMSFNPWQSVSAHRPLGGINRVRKPVYSEMAEFRRTENERR